MPPPPSAQQPPLSPSRLCTVGDIRIGGAEPLAIIGGPCVFESYDLGLEIGTALRDTCQAQGLSFIFKASFDKANRSSVSSPRGPGLERGLEWLAKIRDELGVPVTSDIHEPAHANPAAEVLDLLQIPAFLCRQTDLLDAAGRAVCAQGCAVNVKKGQFLSPREMVGPVRKLAEAGCDNVMLTERGTFFGYHRLVNDFTGLGDLMELDCSALESAGSPPYSPPVCFDVTHSTQLPGSGEQTGGRPDRAALLARAATAAGVAALFIEAHPEPSSAMSDGATQLPIEQAIDVITQCARIRESMT